MTFVIILLVIIVALVVAAVMMYNGLVKQRNTVQEAWHQIDVELTRRHDLIPNKPRPPSRPCRRRGAAARRGALP